MRTARAEGALAVVVAAALAVAIGGGGGYVPGGLGARVEADVRVSPGSTIYAEVGGNGASANLGQNDPAPRWCQRRPVRRSMANRRMGQQLGVLPAYNLYMEVFGGSTTAGGVIDAWPYNGGYANQYFLTFPS